MDSIIGNKRIRVDEENNSTPVITGTVREEFDLRVMNSVRRLRRIRRRIVLAEIKINEVK